MRIRLSILFSVFLGTYFLGAQSDNISFKQLSQKEGLSQNIVTTMLQDQQGIMWFGTENGLNRYDGKQFQLFGQESGLSFTNVSCLAEAKDGKIWIGTKGGGLYYLQPEYAQIRSYQKSASTSFLTTNSRILSLLYDQQNRLWISTDQGKLFCLDSEEDTLINIQLLDDVSPKVYDILEDSLGHIWLGTNAGLYTLTETAAGQFNVLQYSPNKENFGGGSRWLPWRLALGQDGAIWIAAYGSGVYRYEPDKNNWLHYGMETAAGKGPNSLILTSIWVSGQGIVWIGTQDRGLNRLNPQTGDFTYFTHEAGNLNHLGGNYVIDILEDNTEGIWVSSAGSGLNYYNPWRSKFVHHQQQATTSNSLSNNYVVSLFKSKRGLWGSLWIGTHGGGLDQMVYDSSSQSNRFLHYPADDSDPQSLSHEVVLSLTEDLQGNIWVGTFRGLNVLRKEVIDSYVRDQRSRPLFYHVGYQEDEPAGFAERFFSALLTDSFGNIWMATDSGLYHYEVDRQIYSHYQQGFSDSSKLNDNRLLCLFEDSKKRLWVGSHGGVNLIESAGNPQSEPLISSFYYDSENPHSLSYSQAYAIHEDQSGRIWIGTTGGGLNVLLDEGTDSMRFQHFFKSDGLASNNIEGILCDEGGRLWVATDAGLCVFHPDSLLQSKNPAVNIRHYYASDGLQGGEFVEGAFDKGQKGDMYFGGVEGFNVFYPDRLRDNPHSPNVVLTGLRILDREIHVGDTRTDGDTILRKHIGFIQELALDYKDYGFTLEFAALDYAAPDLNQYAYKLEGLDEKWIKTGTRPIATFTNLDPGTYTFRLKGSNNDGVWSEMADALVIDVSPPPWKTWWAYMLYILTLSGLVFGYIHYKIKQQALEMQTKIRIEKAKSEEREKVRKRTAADFHDELGNKMTKISLFVEMAKRVSAADGKLKTYLNQVEDNTLLLSQGIRDFIWVLDPEQDSLLDTLIRIKDFGDEMFEFTDLTFRTIGIEEAFSDRRLALNTRRHLVLICKEAMNNALKYAQASELKFSIENEGLRFAIVIEDNGQGFDLAKVKSGYGLQNIRSRAEKIQAEAQISSAIGKGTQVKILLDLPHMSD
ncbi:MAG: two-component regulator propeller domain-containing protein [Bacteroidia bacterium]